MITSVFALLLILALVAVALGVVTKEPYFSFVGLFFLFNLGLVLLAGSYEYQTGESITTSYTYVNGTLNDTTTTVTDAYTNFDKASAKWYGFLLALTAGFGAFVLFWDLRNGFEQSMEGAK